ncbi:peptidase modulated amidohydrolase [Desulfosarcina variabilis str. Montpellier]|uniref:M20 metallopeptidase family protein n=1 Tax=Desulfosarcina variabilis TaxID=2300 RepID=UPI003AFA87A3
MNIKSLIKPYHQLVIDTRRDLHRIPELSSHEEKTSAYVIDYLKRENLPFTADIAGHGVMAVLDTGRPGPTLMLRADMDALPIAEQTGLSFASQHPGVMHACGHDAHTAMVLVAVTALKALKDQLCGTIKFIFQPAEEGPGGAKPMIEAGVMDNPRVDFALGCHIWPDIPEGTIGIRSGPLLAAASGFRIIIKGRGGHAAKPHLCVDALETGCQVVGALQRIVSRKMDPLAPTVITIGHFQAGTAFNVIPETATIGGTARTFDMDTWQRWPQLIEPVVKGVCDAMGAGYTFTFRKGCPPTVNDPGMARRLRDIAAAVVGPDRVIEPNQTLGGEDMAFYLQKAKGCFFCLGAGNDVDGGLHNPCFNFDETILASGVEVYCRAAIDLLA